MQRIMYLAIQLTFLFSWITGWTFCQAKEVNQPLLSRLNAVNQKLKNAAPGTEALALIRELWTILDEELCSYLDQNEGLSIQELNNGLKDLLGTKAGGAHIAFGAMCASHLRNGLPLRL